MNHETYGYGLWGLVIINSAIFLAFAFSFVDVYMRRLREKLEADPENPVHLKTVRGVGYLFESASAPPAPS
jgi:hypothetical protein